MLSLKEKINYYVHNIRTATKVSGYWLNVLLTDISNYLLVNRIIVTQSNVDKTLGGVIDSTKEYFLDGVITITGFSVEVPAGGIYITGYNFDTSGLVCTDDNATIFTSPIGGSGNILFKDFLIDITGTNSKVYDVVSNTGFEAIEVDKINYNNCTSLGIIDNYRQGLETGTGRFGGTPELTLKGVWVGGYFIDTSIVRSLTDASFTLYKAGAGFLMSSRFRSNQNIDLPASASFLDFSAANFANPSILQLTNCIVTRDGVSNSDDANITPNIDQKALVSDWDGNKGIRNTFIGGLKNLTTEVETVLTVGASLILGTWTDSDLQHFDSNFNYSFRHLGTDPLDFRVTFDFVMKGTQDDQYVVSLKKDNGGVITTIYSQTRTIDRLAGVRDVTYFNGTFGVAMLQNDFLYWEVENITLATNNCTLELNSQFIIEER